MKKRPSFPACPMVWFSLAVAVTCPGTGLTGPGPPNSRTPRTVPDATCGGAWGEYAGEEHAAATDVPATAKTSANQRFIFRSTALTWSPSTQGSCLLRVSGTAPPTATTRHAQAQRGLVAK